MRFTSGGGGETVKIRGAALANRFYKADGWKPELIAALLVPSSADPMPFIEDRGDYYAVYVKRVVFDADKVAQHEYEPYSDSGCDQFFSQKNTVLKGMIVTKPDFGCLMHEPKEKSK